MPSIKRPQRNLQFGTPYAHVTSSCSLNKTVSWHFVWLPLLLSFFYFPEIPHATWQQSKWHVDGGWVFLSVRCWFLSVKWKIRFGRQLRCASYHNNLAPPSSLRRPPPPLLILPAAARLNGQNPWADWYIVLSGVTWKAPTPLPFAVTTITLPSFLLSTLPPIPPGCRGDRS